MDTVVTKFRKVLISALMVTGSTIPFTANVQANDLNIPGASCVAPYLNQAFPMRWHENYLMNPADNIDTWVICPLELDNDTIPAAFVVSVVGARMAGAGSILPSCYVSIYNAANLQRPPFISGPGNNTFTLALTSSLVTPNVPLWISGLGVNLYSAGNVIAYPDLIAATVFCKLPSGYSISTIIVTNDP